MKQTDTNGVQDKKRLGRKGDPLGTVQEFNIWPYKCYILKPEYVLENEVRIILWDCEIKKKTKRSPNPDICCNN